MSDLRSFNLSTREWRREDRFESVEADASVEDGSRAFASRLSSAGDEGEGETATGGATLARLPPRFSPSFCTYMDKFLVVFGGAGAFLPRLHKRESFNDLYFWDITQADKGQPGPGVWVDMSVPVHD